MNWKNIKTILAGLFLFAVCTAQAQTVKKSSPTENKPKIVVGMMVTRCVGTIYTAFKQVLRRWL